MRMKELDHNRVISLVKKIEQYSVLSFSIRNFSTLKVQLTVSKFDVSYLRHSYTNLAQPNLTNLSGATFGEYVLTPKEHWVNIP